MNQKNIEKEITKKDCNEKMKNINLGYEVKKTVCYEILVGEQIYLINAIASHYLTNNIQFKFIISKEKDSRACTFNRQPMTRDGGWRNTDADIEKAANHFLDMYLDDMVEYFEQQTESMYSGERVAKTMIYYAEQCAKEGYAKMSKHFNSQKKHIKNAEELAMIRDFIYSLKGESNPVEFCMSYIAS